MCLMLYLASPRPICGAPPSPLQVHVASPTTAIELRGTITQPHLSLVSVDGCGCAFPSAVGPGPIDHFDGLLGEYVKSTLGTGSVLALLALVERTVEAGETIELFPVWAGNEAKPPRGRIETTTAAIDPEHFCFAESHLYVLRS